MKTLLASPYTPILLVTTLPVVVLVSIFTTPLIATVSVGVAALVCGLLAVRLQRRVSLAQREALIEQLRELIETPVEALTALDESADDDEIVALLNEWIATVSERLEELHQTALTLQMVDTKLGESQALLEQWTAGHAHKSEEIERTLAQLHAGLTDSRDRFEVLCATTSTTEHNGSRSQAEHDEQSLDEVDDFEAEAHRRLVTLMEQRSNLDRSRERMEELLRIILGVAAQTQLVSLNVATEAALSGTGGNGTSSVCEELDFLARNADLVATRTHDVVRSAHEESQRVQGSMDGLGDLTRQQTQMSHRLATRLRESFAELDQLRSEARAQMELSSRVVATLDGARSASQQGASQLAKLAEFQSQLRAKLSRHE